jgi:Reverse transcriptase (RNA-dependent DNA polymerase)
VAVDEEHDRMVKNKVWEAVPKSSVPKGAKILTSTWAMKKKASGVYHARLNARGYEQIDGEHFDKDTKASPVVALMTIMIIFILMIMAGWYGSLTDVHGAFLKGHFGAGEQLYMHVPQGFEKVCGIASIEDHLWFGTISLCMVAYCIRSIQEHGL